MNEDEEVRALAEQYAAIYRKLDVLFAGLHEETQLTILEVKIAELCSSMEDARPSLIKSLERIGKDFLAFRKSLREDGVNLD